MKRLFEPCWTHAWIGLLSTILSLSGTVGHELGADAVSVGFTTHLNQAWTSYGKMVRLGDGASSLQSMLKYVGVRSIRDGVPLNDKSQVDQTVNEAFLKLAGLSVKVDFEIVPDKDLRQQVAYIRNYEKSQPGAVVSIEGPNEVESGGIAFMGLTGIPGLLAFQRQLYSDIKSDQELNNIPVFNFSVHSRFSDAYKKIGSQERIADFANIHPYPGSELVPGFAIKTQIRDVKEMAPDLAVVLTEDGYNSLKKGQIGGLSEYDQARLILMVIGDGLRNGARAIYLYQLMDGEPDSGNGYDAEKHFGVFDETGKPKTAAVAIHNLSAIIGGLDGIRVNDSSPNTGLRIESDAAEVRSVDLVGTNGTLSSLVWAEAEKGEVGPRYAVDASIKLRDGCRSISIFDPVLGLAPTLSQKQESRMIITVGNNPLVVRCE